MTPRDDMLIALRFKQPGQPSTRERARQERLTTAAKNRHHRLAGVARRAALLQAARRRTLRRGPRVASSMVSKTRSALSFGGRVLGKALLIAEAVNMIGRQARRIGGASSRLIEAQDAHAIYGTLDENAAAAQDTRQQLENDSDVLRIIGQEGRVNAQVVQIAADLRREAQRIAVGGDLIDRDPYFDSADTTIDQVTKLAVAELKGIADEAIGAVRRVLGKPTATGR